MAQNSGTNRGRNITPLVLALLIGIAIGANWPKIRKQLKPLLDSLGEKTGDASDAVIRFLAEKKEYIEDRIAAAKIKKKAKPKIAKVKKAKARA